MDKLINLSDNELIDVKIVILTGAKNHLGIANLPNEADLHQICVFLKNKFGDFTAQEIDDAIQRYSAGQIATDAKAYGVISTMFLSDILNEYRVIRKKWKDFEERRAKQQLQLEAPKKDEAEVAKSLTDFIVNWVAENQIIPETYDWDSVYKYLEMTKEIDLSKEDKRDFYMIEREGIIEQVDYYKNVSGKKEEVIELLRILQDEKMMQSFCRRKLVHHYLNKLITKQNGNSSSNENETELQEV